jgi:hypothetical protein
VKDRNIYTFLQAFYKRIKKQTCDTEEWISVDPRLDYEVFSLIYRERHTRRINGKSHNGWKKKPITDVKGTVRHLKAEQGQKWHKTLIA